MYSNQEYEAAVMDLINRIVGQYHSVNDFQVFIDQNLNSNDLDTFEVILALFCTNII